jgi:hypothetical protein
MVPYDPTKEGHAIRCILGGLVATADGQQLEFGFDKEFNIG